MYRPSCSLLEFLSLTFTLRGFHISAIMLKVAETHRLYQIKTMDFKLEAFVVNPTWEMFDKCTKVNLLVIAKHIDIKVAAGDPKL